MSMMGMTIHGYVGSQPTLTRGVSGTQWVRFRVGANSSFRDQEGKWVNGETSWFTCKAWGNMAVNISQSLHKGDPVVVEGRLAPAAYVHSDAAGNPQAQVDLNLHVAHIGVDLARATTMNIKHLEEKTAAASAAQSPSVTGAAKATEAADSEDAEHSGGEHSAAGCEENKETQVSEELVGEIDAVEQDTLETAAPF